MTLVKILLPFALLSLPAGASTLLFTAGGTFGPQILTTSFTAPNTFWEFEFWTDNVPSISHVTGSGTDLAFDISPLNFTYWLGGNLIDEPNVAIRFLTPDPANDSPNLVISFSRDSIGRIAEGFSFCGPRLFFAAGGGAAVVLRSGDFAVDCGFPDYLSTVWVKPGANTITQFLGYGGRDYVLSASVVPEPATFPLVCAGLFALIGIRYKSALNSDSAPGGSRRAHH